MDEQKLLRMVFDALPYLVFVRDGEGRILLANKAYSEFFGVPSGDLNGMSQTSAYDKAKWEQPKLAEWLEQDKKVIASGRALTLEEDVVHKDGSVRRYRTTKVPVKLPAGENVVLVMSEQAGISGK